MQSNVELAVLFFAQLAIILLACRVVGAVAKRFGQPQVVAEMITGVMLGPSLFGWLLPDLQAAIFPWDNTQQTRDTQSYLFPASQLGLALYMFVVGMEFTPDVVRKNLFTSVTVSLAGMITPFCLGAAVAWFLFHNTSLFPERTSLFEAMLFLGASMCITAFPMLARIIHFRGLTGTRMGTVAIGAGAIDDAAAWALLAVVLASFDHDWTAALQNILGGIAYVAIVFGIFRPLFNRLSHLFLAEGKLSDGGFAVVLAFACFGAWFTDFVGLHAVFGAFIMGVAIPRGGMSEQATDRIQPLTVALLLPLFFTYSGLNTHIGLLDSWYLWMICFVILIVSILGKGVACGVAAKLCGLSNRESIGIGTLMNARGLMELIIINIGLQRGIISESIFATLVIMAILTTLIASPIFDLVARFEGDATSDDVEQA